MHGALEVPALFAVELQEGAGMLEHFLVGGHLAEELRDLGLDAAVAGDINLPARVDADDADILDARFGAVAWAARHRELHLVRRVHAPERALELLAHARRILRAEAAPFRAHARLHRAQRLRVRVARRHAEIVPDRGQVLLLHAEEVDAL